MAAESRKLLDFQVLTRLHFLEFSFIDASQEQIVRVSLVIQSQVEDLFATYIGST